jgi:hypothetical protein
VFSLLNTIARGGDGRFCCLWWSVWAERVVAVAGPLVDLAAPVSFCLPGIPGAFQLRGRGHRQLVAGAELAKVQVVLGGSAPLLSATVRTHCGDVELLDPPGAGQLVDIRGDPGYRGFWNEIRRQSLFLLVKGPVT